jgi:hypothetical protein
MRNCIVRSADRGRATPPACRAVLLVDPAVAFDRRRGDEELLAFRRNVVARRNARRIVAFGAGALRAAIDLVDEHVADRTRGEASRRVGAHRREVPAGKFLVEDRVVGVARPRVAHLPAERRRVAEHRREPVLRPRLRHLLGRLQDEHRPGIGVDLPADEVVEQLRLPVLRRQLADDELRPRIREREHDLAVIRRERARVPHRPAGFGRERVRFRARGTALLRPLEERHAHARREDVSRKTSRSASCARAARCAARSASSAKVESSPRRPSSARHDGPRISRSDRRAVELARISSDSSGRAARRRLDR